MTSCEICERDDEGYCSAYWANVCARCFDDLQNDIDTALSELRAENAGLREERDRLLAMVRGAFEAGRDYQAQVHELEELVRAASRTDMSLLEPRPIVATTVDPDDERNAV